MKSFNKPSGELSRMDILSKGFLSSLCIAMHDGLLPLVLGESSSVTRVEFYEDNLPKSYRLLRSNCPPSFFSVYHWPFSRLRAVPLLLENPRGGTKKKIEQSRNSMGVGESRALATKPRECGRPRYSRLCPSRAIRASNFKLDQFFFFVLPADFRAKERLFAV